MRILDKLVRSTATQRVPGRNANVWAWSSWWLPISSPPEPRSVAGGRRHHHSRRPLLVPSNMRRSIGLQLRVHVAFMSRGVADSVWKSLELKGNRLQHAGDVEEAKSPTSH